MEKEAKARQIKLREMVNKSGEKGKWRGGANERKREPDILG